MQVGFFQKHKKSLWASLILTALFTGAVLVYVIYFPGEDPGETYAGDVQLEIEAPLAAASGSEVSYRIFIKNLSNTILDEVELEVFYPLGFTFLDSVPDQFGENDGRNFALPPLHPQGEKTLVMVGRLDGSVQEVKVMSAKLHYIPENFRSVFVASASANTKLHAPDISLRLSGPPLLVEGQKIIYEMQISNISGRIFEKIRVRLTYPDKFSLVDTFPQPDMSDEAGASWDFTDLGIDEKRIVKISGIVTLDPGQEALAQAELFLMDSNNTLQSAGHSFLFTQITPSPLKLTHRLAEQKSEVLPGQVLHYEINYQNTSQVGLNNVVIGVTFDGQIVDLSGFNAQSGQIQQSSIVWIPAVAKELLIVGPGESGKFDLRVPVAALSKLSPPAGEKNPVVKSKVQFHSVELPEPIAGNNLELKIESVMEVVASAVSLGFGEYRIDLTVTNGVNDALETVFTAIVPLAGAEIKVESVLPVEENDNVKFVPNAGLVRWDLGRVFAFSGSFHEARRLSLKLYVPGSAFLDNQNQTLLSDIEVVGTDEFTGNKIYSKKINSVSVR